MKQGHKVCRTCSHFFPAANAPMNLKQLTGNCHRFPPQVALVPMGPGQIGVQSNFPPVTAEMWCGEWSGDIEMPAGFRPLAELAGAPRP